MVRESLTKKDTFEQRPEEEGANKKDNRETGIKQKEYRKLKSFGVGAYLAH